MFQCFCVSDLNQTIALGLLYNFAFEPVTIRWFVRWRNAPIMRAAAILDGRHFFSAPSLGRVELEPINFSLVLSRSYAMCNWTANGWKRSRLATEASSHQAIQFVCFFPGAIFLRPMNENMTHSGVQQSRAGNRCTVTQSGNKTQTAGRDNKQTVTHTSLSGDQLLFVLKYPKTRHQWRRWRVDGSTDEKFFKKFFVAKKMAQVPPGGLAVGKIFRFTPTPNENETKTLSNVDVDMAWVRTGDRPQTCRLFSVIGVYLRRATNSKNRLVPLSTFFFLQVSLCAQSTLKIPLNFIF